MQILSTSSVTKPSGPSIEAPSLTSVPARPRGVTQTEHAIAHLTPASRRVLPNGLLDARIGKSTLAGALNDQVRFRVIRRGVDPANWQIVPDSPTASALTQSAAGAALLQQLRVAVDSVWDKGAKTNLKGFILAKDNESVIAGRALSRLDNSTDDAAKAVRMLGEAGDKIEAGRLMRSWADGIMPSIARAGAWNAKGWITFMPDTARGMLVQARAYTPDPTEKRLLDPNYSTYLAGNTTHEVQHSVTGPSPTAYRGEARWMEEGTANVFSRTPVFHSRNARRAGMTVENYAAQLAAGAVFDVGWGSWTRPQPPKDVQDKNREEASRNYGKSQVVLRDLVRLGGADFRSKKGQQRAFDILQGKSMRYTPGLIADAIIEQHDLDPAVRERLRRKIKVAVDLPGGAKAIEREFIRR